MTDSAVRDVLPRSISPGPVPRDTGGTAQGLSPEKSQERSSARVARDYVYRPLRSAGTLVFGLAIAGLIYLGWLNRQEMYLAPEEGLGYALGIIGSLMMLLLLIYPLRKKLKIMRRLGQVRHWFWLHMMLGILGPTLILFHANFGLGSLNSSVALFSMLAVAASGIIGRYFYTRVHMGLYGRKAQVGEILADAEAFKHAIGADLADIARIEQELGFYEQQALLPYRGLFASLWLALAIPAKTRRSRKCLLEEAGRIVRAQSRRYGWSWSERRRRLRAARMHLSQYFAAIRKAAQFAFFERLFALWHVFHLPLFFFLVLAAIVHVLAVHLY